MRRHIIIAILLSCVICFSLSYAESDSGHKETEELMKYMEAEKTFVLARDYIIYMVVELWKADHNDTDISKDKAVKYQEDIKKVEAMYKKELTWDKVKPSFAVVFEEVYNASERAELLRFFRSPAGIAYMNKNTELNNKLMNATQKSLNVVVPAIDKLLEEEKKSDVKEGKDKE